jgi:hypothetical protein
MVEGGGAANDNEMAEDDKEAQEMVASSKVLTEIYGDKIKLDTFWFFENPVVMQEKPSMGAIERSNRNLADPLLGMNDYGDEDDDYGNEANLMNMGGFAVKKKNPGVLNNN